MQQAARPAFGHTSTASLSGRAVCFQGLPFILISCQLAGIQFCLYSPNRTLTRDVPKDLVAYSSGLSQFLIHFSVVLIGQIPRLVIPFSLDFQGSGLPVLPTTTLFSWQ